MLNDHASAVLGFCEIGAVFLLPLLAWPVAQRIVGKREHRQRVRRVREQIHQGVHDQELLDHVVEDMQLRGELR